MTRYRVTTTARADIRETWEVTAESPEDAIAILERGEAVFIRDEVTGNEEEREVDKVVTISASESEE